MGARVPRMPVDTEGRAHPPPPSTSLGVRASAPPRRARAQRALHFAAPMVNDGNIWMRGGTGLGGGDGSHGCFFFFAISRRGA